jgi:hypothetical protein
MGVGDRSTVAEYLAYQMKYFTVPGKFKHEVKVAAADELLVNGH